MSLGIQRVYREEPPSKPTPTDRTLTNLPPRDRKFTGRFEDIRELHTLLAGNDIVALTQQATREPMGIGKSSTGIAYAWKYLNEYPGGVFFLCGSQEPFFVELAKLSEPLQQQRESNERETATKVCKHLTNGAASLLVIDGIDDPKRWTAIVESGFLPEGNCRKLVVSRCRTLAGAKKCEIARLENSQAVALLAAFRKDAKEHRNASIAGDMVDACHGMPLLVALVGAHMLINTHTNWADCYARLMQGGDGKPDLQQIADKVTDEILLTLPSQHRAALQIAALLPPDQIVTQWLVELIRVESESGLNADGELKEPSVVISDLIYMQLLRSLRDGHKIVGMHEVVRRRIRERSSGIDTQVALDLVADLAKRRAVEVQQAPESSPAQNELSPLLALAGELSSHGRIQDALQVVNQVCPAMSAAGRDYEVVATLDHIKTPNEELNQLITPTILTIKAASLMKVGDTSGARKNAESALKIEQARRGLNDPVVANRHSNLAGILKVQGDLLNARDQIERAIQIEENHFGPEHLNLSIRHWWLGEIALAEHNQEQAQREIQLAYRIMRKHLPEDHPQMQVLCKTLARYSVSPSDGAELN